jgi:hypothetical protein
MWPTPPIATTGATPRRSRSPLDPEKTSYRDLLEFFFQIHDPTTPNGQGYDVGTSYRSAIFYLDDEQRRVAVDTIADVEASGLWPGQGRHRSHPCGVASGRPSHTTRTTSSTTPTATPVTSRALGGSCPDEAKPSRDDDCRS